MPSAPLCRRPDPPRGNGRRARQLSQPAGPRLGAPVADRQRPLCGDRRISPSAATTPLRNVARWIAAPATWSDLEPLAARLRSVGRSRRRGAAVPASRAASRHRAPGRPVGFLDRVGDADAVALYAGVHPVMGDQFLTRDQWELVQLGYVDIALLGFLIPAAPLTGRSGSRLPRLPGPRATARSTVQPGLSRRASRGGGDSPHFQATDRSPCPSWSGLGGRSRRRLGGGGRD